MDVPGNHDRWNVLHRLHATDMFSTYSFTLSKFQKENETLQHVHTYDVIRGAGCVRFISIDMSPPSKCYLFLHDDLTHIRYCVQTVTLSFACFSQLVFADPPTSTVLLEKQCSANEKQR